MSVQLAAGLVLSVYEPGSPFGKYLLRMPYGGLYYYQYDATKPPFDDIKFRAAVSHAVDMPKIVEAVVGDPKERATALISPVVECHNPVYAGYEYDPAKARRLLSESKYGSAENVPTITIGLGAT